LPRRDGQDGAGDACQRHGAWNRPRTSPCTSPAQSANATIARDTATATIIDNDATAGTPVVTINDFVVDEATKEATFVVTLDRPSTGVVSMNYATQNGGALAGSDYVATSGSLNFAAGETAKTVKVTLLNDTASESSEAFNLVLSGLSGATSLDPVGTAIIAENDAAAVSTSNIWWTTSWLGRARLRRFSGTPGPAEHGTVKVNYGTYAGSADSNYDYVGPVGLLTFAPGEMVKTVRVTMINDTAAVEPTENFGLYLVRPERQCDDRAQHGDGDDHRQRRDGGDAGGDDQRLRGRRGDEGSDVRGDAGPAVDGRRVDELRHAERWALAGSDYVATSGSLNFAAGETAKTVKVTLLNDTASESSEAFNLVLSTLSGATSLDPVGTAIIAENDATAVSTSNIWWTTSWLGESQTYADFLVRLDSRTPQRSRSITATYAGTANSYLTTSPVGLLTFAPGEMVKTVRVTLDQRHGSGADRELRPGLSGPERQCDDRAQTRRRRRSSTTTRRRGRRW
jgi:hypothetical protein